MLSDINNSVLFQFGTNKKDITSITLPLSYKNINYKFLYSLDYGSGTVSWGEAINGTTHNNRTINTLTIGTRVGDWLTIGT